MNMKALSEKLQKAVKNLAADDKTFSKQEKEMLAYMYEKYGVEFQVDWSARTIYKDSYDSWNCSIKGNTNEDARGKIEVHRWRNRKDNPYADTYFPILIREEIEKRVHKVFEGYIEPCKAYVKADANYVDNKFCSIDQIDQYLEEKGTRGTEYYITILIPDDGDEKRAEELEEKVLERLKIANIGNCHYNIFWMDKNVYEGMTNSKSNGLHMMKRKDKGIYNKYISRQMHK